jgi:hypothetical protein
MALAGVNIPGAGSAGDIFLQAQFPLHSGRILGLPGRIFVSATGLLVAMLSVTGIILAEETIGTHKIAGPNVARDHHECLSTKTRHASMVKPQVTQGTVRLMIIPI